MENLAMIAGIRDGMVKAAAEGWSVSDDAKRRLINGLAGLAIGGAAVGLGYHQGKKQKEEGEKFTFGPEQLAAVTLIPGLGPAYQAGRAAGHRVSV